MSHSWWEVESEFKARSAGSKMWAFPLHLTTLDASPLPAFPEMDRGDRSLCPHYVNREGEKTWWSKRHTLTPAPEFGCKPDQVLWPAASSPPAESRACSGTQSSPGVCGVHVRASWGHPGHPSGSPGPTRHLAPQLRPEASPNPSWEKVGHRSCPCQEQ